MKDLVVVGVVSAEAPREGLVGAIEAAGATAELCTDATAVAKASAFEAIVLDVGSDADRFVVAAVALAGDTRMRWMPRLIIVAPETPIEQVASFGPAVVLSSAASADTIAAAVADMVEQVRARQSVDRHVRSENLSLRAMEQRLLALQEDGATVSHDARVLFGVIIGFASNLRDGIAGPVTDLQRSHAVNIMEASTGASSLVDRHVAALRAIVREDPADTTRSVVPRTSVRRRQTDLSDLVRSIVALFEGIAAAKQIRLTAGGDREVPSWCDAMQIKQALVNLLANALKFTPPLGSVEVAARFGMPPSSRGGMVDRRDVELVVTDTGPGIPVDQRERVFERGVRLDRDRSSPGSGIGLAVVRDVVEMHGGTVKIEDGPEGGASFVLTFPSDLRSRSGDQLVSQPKAGSNVRTISIVPRAGIK